MTAIPDLSHLTARERAKEEDYYRQRSEFYHYIKDLIKVTDEANKKRSAAAKKGKRKAAKRKSAAKKKTSKSRAKKK